MPVMSSCVLKSLVATTAAATLWFSSTQLGQVAKATEVSLAPNLQQLRLALEQQPIDTALLQKHWQAAETAWQQRFSKPTSRQLDRSYNQLQISYQLYVQTGDRSAFDTQVRHALAVLAQTDAGVIQANERHTADSPARLQSGGDYQPRQLKAR